MFNGCSYRQLVRIGALVEDVAVPAGSTFIVENDPGSTTYVLVDGEARVTVAGEYLNTVRRGDLVGEMAVLDQAPRCASVTATTDVQLLEFDETDFDELIRQPWMARRVLHTIMDRLRATDDSPTA
jgi:CRP-like cAMP-binding protein